MTQGVQRKSFDVSHAEAKARRSAQEGSLRHVPIIEGRKKEGLWNLALSRRLEQVPKCWRAGYCCHSLDHSIWCGVG